MKEPALAVEAVKGHVASLKKMIEEKKAREEELADLRKANPVTPDFVTNGRTTKRKIHATLVDGMHIPPSEWRAKCGFRFGFCRFTRHQDLSGFKDEEVCRKCVPRKDKPAPPSSSGNSTESEISD